MLFLIRARPSDSAKKLCETLGIRRNLLPRRNQTRTTTRTTANSNLIPRGVTHLINWGVSERIAEFVEAARRGIDVLNPPDAVKRAVNKATAFTRWQAAGVPVPKFWLDSNSVVRGTKDIILVRTQLSASCGDGIIVVRPEESIPSGHHLYVKYEAKLHEYRVHVVMGEAVLVQQKRKREGFEQSSDQSLIRNYDNGWVFAVNNVVWQGSDTEARVKAAAVQAVSTLGLDFGAVDIIVGKRDGNPYVLEVNTAPGIESPTLLEAYRRKFNEVR
jgi:glutathione synthase/RimK-type ligase-like ATP-grasp enzyme